MVTAKASKGKHKHSKPKKRDPQESRSRLLRAAIRLFSEKGYNGVSVDEIVASARLSKRMVYHYFGDKENLYRAALVEVYRRLEQEELKLMESERDPAAMLAEIFTYYFRFHHDNPEFNKLLLWENLNKGRVIRKHRQLLSKVSLVRKLVEVVERGKASGAFRPDLDPIHLYIALVGLSFVYHSNRYTLSQAVSADLTSAAVLARGQSEQLKLLLDGICRQPAADSRG